MKKIQKMTLFTDDDDIELSYLNKTNSNDKTQYSKTNILQEKRMNNRR